MCACVSIARLVNDGMNALNSSRLDEAESLLGEALELARRVGSPMHRAKIRNNLGLVHQARGDNPAAATLFRSAMADVESRVGRENRVYRTIEANLHRVATA